MPLTFGSSAKTRFTLAHGPFILIPWTARRNSSGRSPFSRRPRNVRLGSALESTVAVEALQLMLAPAEQVKQESQGRARIVRAAMFPVDTVGQEKSFYFLRFIVAIEKLAQAAGQEGN